MSQELYLNLDTLEGYAKVREDRWRRYHFTIAPDRSGAEVITAEFDSEEGKCIGRVVEWKTQAELVNDMSRTPTFNWIIRGFFGTPLLYKGNECHKETIKSTT